MADDISALEMPPSVCDVVCEGLSRAPVAPGAQTPGSLYMMAGLGRIEGVET